MIGDEGGGNNDRREEGITRTLKLEMIDYRRRTYHIFSS